MMNDYYRAFVKALSLILLTCLLCPHAKAENAPKKPNIVFILVDDLGWHQLGSYGSDFYETPNIDQLAKEGMRFTQAYAAAPICSPTRASIMTGKYPARLHLTDFLGGKRPRRNQEHEQLIMPDWQKSLPLEEITIAEELKRAGYATGHFGKWHLSIDKNHEPGRPGDPASQGFDEVLTTHKPGAGPDSIYDEDRHHVREITERSIAFIRKNKDKPFFCYVSHNSIHDPEIEKEALIEKYQAKPGAEPNGRNNPTQAAMLETVDKSIADILKALDELELENDTLVLFYSDNGQKGVKEGQPFRGSKADLYEGGIRMPLIAKWPGVITPGSESDAIVISNDLLPTFTDMAGLAPTATEIDGISLLPLFKDPEAELPREAVYWHYPHFHAKGLGPQGAVRMGRYKLIEWYERSLQDEPGAFELYDLIRDPGEQNNLAERLPKLTARLKAELKSWKEEVGAQFIRKR